MDSSLSYSISISLCLDMFLFYSLVFKMWYLNFSKLNAFDFPTENLHNLN